MCQPLIPARLVSLFRTSTASLLLKNFLNITFYRVFSLFQIFSLAILIPILIGVSPVYSHHLLTLYASLIFIMTPTTLRFKNIGNLRLESVQFESHYSGQQRLTLKMEHVTRLIKENLQIVVQKHPGQVQLSAEIFSTIQSGIHSILLGDFSVYCICVFVY